METSPLVSVIMPVFNSERFLEEAARSILTQTYKNLECIIVDDGSIDRSREIAKKLQRSDSRINFIPLEKNQGVANASNVALRSARGKYIARMDADDISLKDRFSQQVRFLEAHPEVGILGTGMRYMNEVGRLFAAPPVFQGDIAIRWHILFENPFFNPTVMFRKSVIDSFNLKYDTGAIYGDEDYDYVSRLIAYTKGENLADILLYYRVHPSSLSYRYENERNESVVMKSSRAVVSLLPEAPVSLEEIFDLQRAIKGTSAINKRMRSKLFPVYLKLWETYRTKHSLEPGLAALTREVFAWAARMILYPPFQNGMGEALRLLTKTDRKWPIYLIGKLPYYLSRRMI